MNTAFLRGALLSALCVSGIASANDYRAEYDKKIKAAQNVGALGDDLAGDSVNFYTGATSFHATDISVPTNGLPLTLGRRFNVSYGTDMAAVNGSVIPDVPEIVSMQMHDFGGWDLDVPSISTVMSQSGWQIQSNTPDKRCSVIGQTFTYQNQTLAVTGMPPPVGGSRGWVFNAGEYWNGYSMRVLGGEKSLLLASLSSGSKPNIPGKTFHWTTNDNWWVSCLAQTANGKPGEAYEAISPDGTVYTFDWLSKRNINSIMTFTPPEAVGGIRDTYMFRADYFMLATRVVDRFGNWLRYHWIDPPAGSANPDYARLDSITAGVKGSTTPVQKIQLHYGSNGYIDWASDGSRTWTYQYIGPNLAKVILPDQSYWGYGLSALSEGPGAPVCGIDEQVPADSDNYKWTCFGGGELPYDVFAGGVHHPSGAQIDFVFENRYQYSPTQEATYVLGIRTKTISGPGLSTATWKFDHVLSKEEIRERVLARPYVPVDWLATDQINPDNTIVRRIYGLAGTNQSLLVGELRGALAANSGGSPPITASAAPWGAEALSHPAPGAAGTPVPIFYNEAVYTYPATGVGYAARAGVNPLGTATFYAQSYASEHRTPRQESALTQQGVTFKHTVDSFDAFARPLSITRSSAGNAGGSFTRTELLTYQDQTGANEWVIGLPRTVSVNGNVLSDTQYDPTLFLPSKHSRFGIVQDTLGYNADGTLAWAKDGAGNQTSLEDWYRGVPRKITFPGGVTRKATVNAAGDILSTEDELHSETKYGYDDLGRLASITYPTEGAPWAMTTRSFVSVPFLELGLPKDHWKQTVKTGDGWTTTYFDGRWNPVLTVTEDVASSLAKSFVVRRFDVMGRETFRSYPVASTTDVNAALPGLVTQYDALGRVSNLIQDSDNSAVLTTKTEYLGGFQTKVTNPNGKSTTTSYQVFDAPATDSPVLIQAPQGVTTSIVRDVFGKPLSITRSGPGA